ncbi:Hsp20/alpha crystallin family protein [Patescibacteria group bacterium]|nr:Hsp20/alpha crystallin family protein [Patescibacteria group bacterium]MBU1500760.1 Hsp20/alpha crystallin family protein [Patescibacteria group bacterium]MBU2080815.1 Hsp20/alpha crystallin family protein [Patescibacteria group bacterium]MBU2123920.1 Hsp20/alpha crystallin family protein [Patescibacteria group bacterium]MBU2194789.1 Hsp20/alpha crystallin family protein [Patescibacteria group bacterium]
MKKRSFFDRLSGSAPMDDQYDGFDDDLPMQSGMQTPVRASVSSDVPSRSILTTVEEEHSDGQLPVDVYQTPNEIVIRAFVAGVRPDELNVSISRDMVVIEGSRDERDSIVDSDYFTRELFWGSFSRTILLPQEVDVDNSSAGAKDGLLSIILPKLDKARQTKLRVKAG